MHGKYPEPFENVIDMLRAMPGVGRRTAERMAFSMLQWPPGKLQAFAEIMSTLKEKLTPCPECGNLSSEKKPCSVCANLSRDKSLICVVENAAQIISIEAGGFYKGVYHVLGGKLSPLDGRTPEHLNIELLLRRVEKDSVRELIFALSPDVEGQATTFYIGELLKGREIKLTRLAQGLPAGSDISYADSATIAAALQGRTDMK